MRFIRTLLVSLLTLDARLALALHHPKIVAVTGNLGKTTTKDAIFAVIPASMQARKSEKSFNSDIGVPLAILGLDNPWSNPLKWIWTLVGGIFAACLPNFPKLLVLEVGADRPGDISSIARWLKPDIAVYTGVPEIPVHVANFRSREELVREKRSLLQHVRPGGTAIVNGDLNSAEALQGISAEKLLYGFESNFDVAASEASVMFDERNVPIGMSAKIISQGKETQLKIFGTLGKPVISSALAALAVARTLGVGGSSASNSLATWRPPAGRMRILPGVKNSVIIDDTYNASPAATLAALATFQELPAKRRIAVLGDMRELGEKSAEAHREVGRYVARVADMLVTVGEESKVLAQAARETGMPQEKVREYGYDSSEQVGKDLAAQIGAGDIILVKGSQNRIRLERCVYELLADKSQAGKLLVRFDKTWRGKA